MGSRTTFLNLYKPTFRETGWDVQVNENWDALDTIAQRQAENGLNVASFGTLGTSDDTNTFQNCLNEAAGLGCAEIIIPYRAGGYNVDDLELAPASGQIHVNVRGVGGVGAGGVRLNYIGSGTALTIKNNTRYEFKNLRLVDAGSGARGLYLTSLTAGSNHGNATYLNTFVSGFTTNLQIGDTENKAASELLFVQCEFTAGTTGVLIQGPASGTSFSTGITFHRLQAVSNDTVLVVAGDNEGTQPKITVNGFSLSFNDREFDFQVPVVADLSSGYTESDTNGELFRSGSATATLNSAYVTNVTVRSVTTNYPSSPSNFVARCYQPGHYQIDGCNLQTGSIELGGFDGGGGARKSCLTVKHSTIASAADRIQYRASSNTLWLVRHQQSGTANIEAQNMDDDRTYLIKTDGSEHDFESIPWSESQATLEAL
jgi:hypothetical protein